MQRLPLVVWLVLGAACSKQTADPPVTPVAGSAVRDAAPVSADAAAVADPALVLADAAIIVADAAVGVDAGTAKGACVRDADCELVNGTPPNCCSRCRSQAVTRAEAAKVHRACSQPRSGDYHDRCPHLSCTCVKEQAVCKAGKCTVQAKGC